MAVETVGYVGRAINHSNKQALTPYIMQSILILVAPALFAATIYMALGRITRALDAEAHSVIPLRWLTKIFVTGDVLSFFIISGGGGIQAQAHAGSDKVKLGQNIILGGLFLQIVLFGFFVGTAVVFHLRLRKIPTRRSYDDQDWDWQKMLIILYAVSTVIMTRNIFRVIEYAMGRDTYLLRVEWPVYIFDAVLMTAVMVMLLLKWTTIRSNRHLLEENVKLGSAEVVNVGSIVPKA